jgi:uncharacterized protein (UPF0248 family)
MNNPIRDQLNRHKWQSRDLDSLTLVVRHRGAPKDETHISGSKIVEIRPDGVVLSGAAEDEDSFIPYHRILAIRSSR